MALAVIVQNLLCLSLIIWLFVSRSKGKSQCGLRVFSVWSVLIGIFLLGLWHYLPVPAYGVYGVLAGAATIVHCIRSFPLAPRKTLWPNLLNAGLLVFGFCLIGLGIQGRFPPPGPVIDLASPLKTTGGMCVVSGGSNLALNLHFVTGQVGQRNPEKHAVDFISADCSGMRLNTWHLHPQPEDIRQYRIYLEPVFAPCSGTVIAAVNDRPDHPAGQQHRDKDGSNLVALRCGETDVYLIHLLAQSVTVSEGEEVATGQHIGTIGHSGNSEEPHLHIHAEQKNDLGETVPVVMTFNGRYLSRGDCLSRA